MVIAPDAAQAPFAMGAMLWHGAGRITLRCAQIASVRMWGWIRSFFHPIRHILPPKSLIYVRTCVYENILMYE